MPGVSPGVRTAGENRLQASTDAIPEVSRQKYQEAALSGLIAVGQEIPDDWVPGDQFAFSADGRFRMGEVVVVATNDGNLRFGRVKSITSSGQEAPGSYTVSVSESRLGTRYKELAAEQVGKVLPLSQREIQRLGSSDLASNGSKTTTIRNGGFFSSFRNLVDVDKTLGREETLPFQPMLSRRAMTPADSKMVPKPAGRVSTVMSGADSGDWGELDGWWRNEQDQTDTFEVLLQRPLGMELDEVDGEGIFVKALEDGGNAQRAGIRVGDRILVPGKEAARGSSWRDDLVSVLSAISDSTGNRMRLRYVRSVAAAASANALAASSAKQQERGKAQTWRGRSSASDTPGEVQVLVKKPIGMRLTEVEGKGIFVSELEPDGNACAAGIRVGDRVIKTSCAPGFQSGIEFDRGTTYLNAVYSKTQPSALERFLSEVKAPGGAIEIGLERSKEGQAMIEQVVARQRLGAVDETLSAKVKRAVLGPFMSSVEDEAAPGAADAVGGEQMMSVGRPLPINLDLLSHSARVAMRQGNSTLAQLRYQECTQMDPWDGRGWVGLAKVYEKRGQCSKAREVLLEGLNMDPTNPFILQTLGCLEVRGGNLAEAHRRFQQATTADPKHAASWVSWGKLEERFRRAWRARQCYAKAAAVDPANYYAWQCLAVLESKSGDLNAARALFTKCTEVNPNNAASWQAWGTMERQAGNVDKAADLLARGLRGSPKNTWVMQALALLEWERGNTEKAEKLFEKAMALKPWDGGLYQTLGVLLHKSGRVDRARLLFKQGSHAAKDHAALWQAWALMEAEAGKVVEARALFQQGVWGAGSSPKVHALWQAWGLFEAKQGNFDDARKYLARAVDAADRPATPLLAWALVEERQGAVAVSAQLMDKAVTAEPANSVVWTAYLRFARRNYGEGSEEAAEVYERKVVAEIRTRSERQEAFPQLDRIDASESARQGSAAMPRGDIFLGDDFGADREVLMKAKWGAPRARGGQGSGWQVAQESL